MLWSDLEGFERFFDPWRDFEPEKRTLWRRRPTTEFPPVNLWVNRDNLIITTEIPGIAPETIDITVADKSLTIRGSREPEEEREGESYHRRERWHGTFSKTLELPFSVESGKVEAQVTKGILTLSLPRAEAEKPKKITIKSE